MKKTIMLLTIMLAVLCFQMTALAGGKTTCELNVEYDYESAEQLLTILNRYRESGEAWILDRNGERIDLGSLPPFVLDETLTDAAMQRASELIVTFSHTRPDGNSCFTAHEAIMGENIGLYCQTPERMFELFAEEKENYYGQGHRRNMLNQNYTHVGIGVVKYDGRLYWSMDFSDTEPTTNLVTEKRTNDMPAVVIVDPDSGEIAKSILPSTRYAYIMVGETAELPGIYETYGCARVTEIRDVVWTCEDPTIVELCGTQIHGLKSGRVHMNFTVNGKTDFVTVVVSKEPVSTPAQTPIPTSNPTLTPAPVPVAAPDLTQEPIVSPAPVTGTEPEPTTEPEPESTPESEETPEIITPPEHFSTPRPVEISGPEQRPVQSECSHIRVRSRDDRPATCMHEGLRTYTCQDCGTTWTEKIPVNPDNHRMTGISTMRSECGRAFKCYYCEENCGYWVKGEQIEGGDRCCWGTVEVIIPATADSEGTGIQTCAYCRETRTVTIPKLEVCTHANRTTRMTKEATCWEFGTEEEYCEDCGIVLNTWSVPKKEHEWLDEGELIREANCEQNGQINHKCRNYAHCRNVLADCVTLQPLGHEYQLNAGGKYVCTRCGNEKPNDSAPEQDDESVEPEPVRPDDGGCDHVNTARRITEEATCWRNGTEEEYCTDCGTVVCVRAIPKAEHEWEEEGTLVREATCEVNGQIDYKCKHYDQCRNSLGDCIQLPPLGHDYQKNNEGKYVCIRCGKQREE